jgi:hypothetical protein
MVGMILLYLKKSRKKILVTIPVAQCPLLAIGVQTGKYSGKLIIYVWNIGFNLNPIAQYPLLTIGVQEPRK